MNREYNNKYNLDPKYIKCAGCPKPAQSRLSKVNTSGFVPAFRGPNNTELCCKCAEKEEFLNVCYKCRRKGQRKTSFGLSGLTHLYIKDEDNPSGEWWVYCCNECLPADHPQRWGEMVWESHTQSHIDEQYFKPNPPVEGKPNLSSTNSENWSKYCNYCEKFTEVKFGNTKNEKTFCSRDCYVAAGNEIQKGKCRIAGCSREAYYECMDLCLSHSKPCRGTYMGKKCNLALGTDEGDFCGRCQIDSKENSLSPNPCAPASQSITNQNDQSDNSVKVNPGNSPKSNSGKDDLSETKSNVKTIKFENKDNSNKNNPVNPEADNETLIINLKSVKKISLTAEGNLVIEFNCKQGDDQYYSTQTIASDQINHNQELQKVRSYLKKSNQTSLNKQELDKILNKSNNNSALDKKPQDGNKILIGCALGGTFLILGIVIGLWLRKKKVKKN